MPIRATVGLKMARALSKTRHPQLAGAPRRGAAGRRIENTSMTAPAASRPTHSLPGLTRKALGALPRDSRFALYRRMVDCDAAPDSSLQLGIAASQEELEACFSLLHDAYVSSGFMQPHASGLRVTPYHALPTTTTLYARFDGRIVGTLSIVREGEFGFPMQSVFDLTAVRTQPGRIAEISALAIDPRFRGTGGSILFPLMKFMYEYCTRFFDTRHLVIAVNPKHIEMYESLLLFRRLQAEPVASYDFVNGAPAVGATLDLLEAPEMFRAAYAGRRQERNLHHYFTEVKLPHIRFPQRRYFTTNDPVMSPALLDHFFNRRTQVFEQLNDRQRRLLHAIYPEPAYRSILPAAGGAAAKSLSLRRHHRYSLKCPAQFSAAGNGRVQLALEVIDASLYGFLARAAQPLPDRAHGTALVHLGHDKVASEQVATVRSFAALGGHFYGFRIDTPSQAWRQCVAELESRGFQELRCTPAVNTLDG
jgi:GNAT superfamily N-acetyltransferase